MNLRRVALAALITGAAIFILSGCGKSTSATSVNNLDSTPPATPANVASAYDPNVEAEYLTWAPSSSPDVVAYEIWQYDAMPVTGSAGTLACVAPAAAHSIALPGQSETVTLFYRVRARDAAGNCSPFSAAVQIVRHGTGTSSSTDGQDGIDGKVRPR